MSAGANVSPYTVAVSRPAAFYRVREGAVYCVNTVGYVNLTLTSRYNLIQNPLQNATGNTIATVLAGMPDGTLVYKYNPASGYAINMLDLNENVIEKKMKRQSRKI